ncbi:MAG: FkbM family methyltransferase [bacterium]
MNNTLGKIITKLTYKFPNLSMWYRFFRDYLNRHKKPTLTKQGFYLTGNTQMENDDFELEETKLIQELLKNADIFINIGANIGYYCCFSMQQRKKTIAFEPLPSNLFLLYKNMKLNKWSENIEIHPIALSNQCGITDIYGHGTGASTIKGWAGNNAKFSHIVPVNSLDTVISDRFADKMILVVMDVEGAELNVLKGSINIINRTLKPIWFVEISISEHQPEGININPNLLDTFKIFWETGYSSVIANKSLREIKYKDIEMIIQTQRDNLNSHNFIFFDKSFDINKILNNYDNN